MNSTESQESLILQSRGETRAQEAFRNFSFCVLRIAPGAEAVLAASNEMPDEPLPALGEALFWLFAQTAEGQVRAAEALDKAGTLSPDAPQERWLEKL